MNFEDPVGDLFLVGPAYARRLEKLSITTVGDLLYHFPFRYIDYSLISPIGLVQPEEVVTVRGEIISSQNVYTKYGKKIQKVTLQDSSGTIEGVWFNQPFLVKTLRVGEECCFSGKVGWFGRQKVMVAPEYEMIRQSPTIHTGRLVPVYHETYGISSKWLRTRIAGVLDKSLLTVTDFLPLEIMKNYGLIDLKTALNYIHFPEDKLQAEKGRQRFAFEELFLLQLRSQQRKKGWQKKKAVRLLIPQEKILNLTARLPFTLTAAQNRCAQEILTDLGKDRPMNRLLQGDVGSGKTVVAAIAMYAAFLNGYQAALMAPTEILATQHFQTLGSLLKPLGVKVALLTGSKKSETRNEKRDAPDIMVGTHALIYKRAKFAKLGLVVIDEQHRFGVEQRAALIAKAPPGKFPHLLTMTATPIPRTIALTLYGDLDLSVIDEMPIGRPLVKTWVVPPAKRMAAYDWLRNRVKNTDEQAFIICPLIEESETLQSVRAVTTEFERLKKEIFPDLRLGLLHGRLKTKEKDETVAKLRTGKLDLLISTPVVEVGLDIPQATIMIIEAADRFGLAQLHQLRGRVGRGVKASYCLLFTEQTTGKAFDRLQAMEKLHVGLKLAELDLKMRGPGEIYGTAQHGFPELKIASFTDANLIKETAGAVTAFAGKLAQYPQLQKRLKEVKISTVKPN